ncbi:hypothetical protein [Kocuria arenosa]
MAELIPSRNAYFSIAMVKLVKQSVRDSMPGCFHRGPGEERLTVTSQ